VPQCLLCMTLQRSWRNKGSRCARCGMGSLEGRADDRHVYSPIRGHYL
jgi:hypothetical protein